MNAFETENFIRITRSEARHRFYHGMSLYFGDIRKPEEIGKYKINYKNNTRTFDENINYFKTKMGKPKEFIFLVRKENQNEKQ